ncbi:ceramide synthase 1 [Lissotriton helveticus]
MEEQVRRTMAPGSGFLDLQEVHGSSVAVEAMPGYLEVLDKGGSTFVRALERCKGCGWELAWRTLQKEACFDPLEVLLLVLCAVGLTILREVASRWLFLPFAQWCNLQPKDAAKVPESAWKLLFYTMSWGYSVHLLFFKEYTFFWDPPSTFHGWVSGMEVPWDITVAYLLQGSFYAHSTYATLYMDAWRKDSVVMLVHHLVTLVLICVSYAFRYHNIGILVLFLHDVSDIQLEFTKLNVYFKNRGGTYHCLNDILSNVGCLTFSISWFWFRLYWFPLKVLYATCYSSLQSVPNIPFYFFLNILLFAITLMNVYWFLYIVLFVGKVLTGQMQEVNDVREYDTDESEETQPLPKNGGFSHNSIYTEQKIFNNGIVKDKQL